MSDEMRKNDNARKSNPGPDAERLRIDGDWEMAVDKALSKPRPEGGWPDACEPEKDDEDDRDQS